MRHYPVRRWRTLFVLRCACGNKTPCPDDPVVNSWVPGGGPIPDGDVYPLRGFARWIDLLKDAGEVPA